MTPSSVANSVTTGYFSYAYNFFSTCSIDVGIHINNIPWLESSITELLERSRLYDNKFSKSSITELLEWSTLYDNNFLNYYMMLYTMFSTTRFTIK